MSCLLVRTILLGSCLGAWCGVVCAAQQPPSSDAVAGPKTPTLSTRPDFSHARNLMQQGKADDAIVELESIKASAPNTPGLDLELGTAYYKKSDYVKAIGFLKTTVAADPSNNEAIQLLGL